MNKRITKDWMASKVFYSLALFSVLVLIAMGIGLFLKSLPLLKINSLTDIFLSTEWKPSKGLFGFWAYLYGTLYVTFISLLIGIPLALFTAIYLSEYASYKVRKTILPLVDLLSGIPPVIYGVWGVLVIVPLIEKLAGKFSIYSSGYSALAGGIVLSVMIIPLMVSVLIEVFQNIPQELRNASLSLGANSWETTYKVLLKSSLAGIIAAIVLALSRALGETIAVLMVCGNMPIIPNSIFESVYPLPALIANNYGEMLSVPLYESALMLAAFILFLVILVFNFIARVILHQLEKNTITN